MLHPEFEIMKQRKRNETAQKDIITLHQFDLLVKRFNLPVTAVLTDYGIRKTDAITMSKTIGATWLYKPPIKAGYFIAMCHKVGQHNISLPPVWSAIITGYRPQKAEIIVRGINLFDYPERKEKDGTAIIIAPHYLPL